MCIRDRADTPMEVPQLVLKAIRK
jgi:hypothetical protein